MHGFMEVGCLVSAPNNAEWGLGQVQSIIGNKVTVNFINAGKQVIDTDIIELQVQAGDSY